MKTWARFPLVWTALVGVWGILGLAGGWSPATGQVVPTLPCPGLLHVGAPNGLERLQIGATAVSPTGGGGASPFATAAMAVLVIEGASDVRYLETGATPRPGSGMLIDVSVNPVRIVCAGSVATLKLVRESGDDAVAWITYYGR